MGIIILAITNKGNGYASLSPLQTRGLPPAHHRLTLSGQKLYCFPYGAILHLNYSPAFCGAFSFPVFPI